MSEKHRSLTSKREFFMTTRAVRIASFSGFIGDRFEALGEALNGDPVDVLIGDFLAEISLAPMAVRHKLDQSKGYAERFIAQITPHLGAISERGLKIVVNAGGFNPGGLANILRDLALEAGVGLRIAHIEGDNLLGELPALQAAGESFTHLDNGQPISEWGANAIAANVYLGGWGIARCLKEGADIVICGRVTDASLVLGPAAWWHGWDESDWDRLAGAVVAGHVIECGPQATGGNFSGFLGVPNISSAGFPIAEIDAQGDSVICKHSNQGGAVTVATVTAQLVYEIQGPAYLNPDVICDLSSVELIQVEPDRVKISGVRGSPPPDTAKVAIFAQIGWHIAETVYVTGRYVREKVALLGEQIQELLGGGVTDIRITPFGVPSERPMSQWEATVPVRVMVSGPTRESLERLRLNSRLGVLYLSSVPGFYQDQVVSPAQPRPRIDYWPALLPIRHVTHRAHLWDQRTIDVPPPRQTQRFMGQVLHEPSGRAPASGPTVRLALGDVAYARSGDKGGNSNVGVWVEDVELWEWLRTALTTDAVRNALPETQGLDIVRHEFPKLKAVHFVLRGLLGTGGASNWRPDQTGKAVGEYLLATPVDVPTALLRAGRAEVNAALLRN